MLSQNNLQYTEGNAFKVPVLRHNMTEIQLKSVASVIRMGFIQERIYPIKLVPSLIRMSYINDALEQYAVKQALNSENIKRILREVAHKELVQKLMFIADSFNKVLNATPRRSVCFVSPCPSAH